MIQPELSEIEFTYFRTKCTKTHVFQQVSLDKQLYARVSTEIDLFEE